MEKYQAVIFDKDGLLLDTEMLTFRAFSEAFKKHGIELPLNVYEKSLGISTEDSFQIFKNFLNNRISDEELLYIRSDFLYAYFDLHTIPVKKGVQDFLTFLKVKNIPCAIATSCETSRAKDQFDKLELLGFFNVVIGKDKVQNAKPFPDIFLKAGKLLNCDPSKIIAFEDSEAGITAIKNAGMTAVHVKDLLPPNQNIINKADFLLDSLLEAPMLFN